MSKQAKPKNSASESDPNPMIRWLVSSLMTHLFSERGIERRRAKAESRRRKRGEAHRIEYFHQLNDGYSHLTAQALKPLAERYNVEFICHLVTPVDDDNLPEPDLLRRLSRDDARQIAPEYGLEFPSNEQALSTELQSYAATILTKQDSNNFIECVVEISTAMWQGDKKMLEKLAAKYGTASKQATEKKLNEGTQRRTQLKHYSGAMFYYGNEWYWGVDRLYHLEKRLASLGADKKPDQPLLFDRPSASAGQLKDNGSLTLEVFPSLRSPYTAISFDRAVKLARDSGVKLVVRPILPMVMRGVPATREKGMYIFMDTAREAYASGTPYGNFYDPIGNPVRNAYSLYPWAVEQGKEVELISSFLGCAFAQGINTNRQSGLRQVVEQAGLDWNTAKDIIGKSGWETALEQNRFSMYQAGLWGVPSFRLLDAKGDQIIATWGQDRLWLIAREIQDQLAKK